MNKNQKDINKVLESLKATMSFENLKLAEADLKACERILRGEITADRSCAEIVKKYKVMKP